MRSILCEVHWKLTGTAWHLSSSINQNRCLEAIFNIKPITSYTVIAINFIVTKFDSKWQSSHGLLIYCFRFWAHCKDRNELQIHLQKWYRIADWINGHLSVSASHFNTRFHHSRPWNYPFSIVYHIVNATNSQNSCVLDRSYITHPLGSPIDEVTLFYLREKKKRKWLRWLRKYFSSTKNKTESYRVFV